jgi:hypothetical protein
MNYLPGSERFARPHPVNKWVNLRVDMANRDVSVLKVLKDLWQVYVPEGMGHKSWKTFCPLGWEHPDGGVDKGFRVYEATNTAYCFVMHGSLSPVRLAQIKWGGSNDKAARRLLEMYGLGRRPWRERYEELLEQYERSQQPGIQSNIVEALQVRLSTESNYWALQYEPSVIEAMERELEELDVLFTGGHPSDEQVRAWYQSAIDRILLKVREVDQDAPG